MKHNYLQMKWIVILDVQFLFDLLYDLDMLTVEKFKLKKISVKLLSRRLNVFENYSLKLQRWNRN